MDPLKPRSTFEIPGTKFSMKNSQMFVSSGVSSVDELIGKVRLCSVNVFIIFLLLIGGGLPVGTVTLLGELLYILHLINRNDLYMYT